MMAPHYAWSQRFAERKEKRKRRREGQGEVTTTLATERHPDWIAQIIVWEMFPYLSRRGEEEEEEKEKMRRRR